jgi:MFS family permease
MKYTPIPSADDQARAANATSDDGGYFGALRALSSDAKLLLLSKSVRMYSFGYLAVALVIYLQELGFSSVDIGTLFSLTLLGDVLISILLTSHADRWGRRFTLLSGSALAVVTSVVFCLSSNFWVLLIAATIGVISPSGNEIGPFMAIEISSLSQVTPEKDRTMLMAWYNLFSCFSSATGALMCGYFTDQLVQWQGATMLQACRAMMFIYAGIQAVVCVIFSQLSDTIEAPSSSSSSSGSSGSSANPLTSFLGLHKSKAVVLKLSLLFLMDSFGGSFVLQSIISGWFFDVYGTPGEKIGGLVFACNLVAGVSALLAARLADKIGLILTMFVTHLPSNVLLILVPLMPNESLAIFVLILRFSISQMDVPTRNAYVQGVVAADERSAANGVTNVVRSVGASTGPYLAGLLYASPSTRSYPYFIAGGIKIAYDVLLLQSMWDTPTALENQLQKQHQSRAVEGEAVTELSRINRPV